MSVGEVSFDDTVMEILMSKFAQCFIAGLITIISQHSRERLSTDPKIIELYYTLPERVARECQRSTRRYPNGLLRVVSRSDRLHIAKHLTFPLQLRVVNRGLSR